jgi:hypothetical protein
MNRFILEDTYESFIKSMQAIVSHEGVHKGHVVRCAKQDGANYQRLMDASTLFSDTGKTLNNRMYESHYIFLEKHFDSLQSVALINVQNEFFFKRKFINTVLASRIRSLYLEARPVEQAIYQRFTSSHRLLCENDILFDSDPSSLIRTTVVKHDELQRVEKYIIKELEPTAGMEKSLHDRFVKLAVQYKEDYLMSKVVFSESISEGIDLRSKIIEQQEEFIETLLFTSNTRNIKYIYRQTFDNDAKIWIIDKLELLNNI